MLARAKRRNLFLSIILAFGLLGFGVVSCTTMENLGGGLATGGALGAGAGALAGDPLTGALIGMGVGLVGGAIKDGMEKEGQRKVDQAQTNAEVAQLRAELIRQKQEKEAEEKITLLKKNGFPAKEYTFDVVVGQYGGVSVTPVKREEAETEMNWK